MTNLKSNPNPKSKTTQRKKQSSVQMQPNKLTQTKLARKSTAMLVAL